MTTTVTAILAGTFIREANEQIVDIWTDGSRWWVAERRASHTGIDQYVSVLPADHPHTGGYWVARANGQGVKYVSHGRTQQELIAYLHAEIEAADEAWRETDLFEGLLDLVTHL